MRNILSDDATVFRKFMSENSDTFISVRADSYSYPYDAEDDSKGEYKDLGVDLNIGDGSNMITVWKGFSTDTEDLDDEYTKAMDELSVLRDGITAAMEELAGAYADIQLNKEANAQLDLPFDE